MTTLFELKHQGQVIGRLGRDRSEWTYTPVPSAEVQLFSLPYTPASQVYRSATLWPTFLSRIPDIGQDQIRWIISVEGIDANDQVALLKRFGRRAIANPFELVYVGRGAVNAEDIDSHISFDERCAGGAGAAAKAGDAGDAAGRTDCPLLRQPG